MTSECCSIQKDGHIAVSRNHEGPHSREEPVEGCYGCQLKAKDFSLSAAAAPSRQNNVRPRQPDQPSWEKGRAGEHRADGSFMPYTDANLRTIPIKEYGEKRHKLDSIRRQQLNQP